MLVADLAGPLARDGRREPAHLGNVDREPPLELRIFKKEPVICRSDDRQNRREGEPEFALSSHAIHGITGE